jgi:hypothetical protein
MRLAGPAASRLCHGAEHQRDLQRSVSGFKVWARPHNECQEDKKQKAQPRNLRILTKPSDII